MEKRSLIRKQILEDKINNIQEKKMEEFKFDAKIVVKFDKKTEGKFARKISNDN